MKNSFLKNLLKKSIICSALLISFVGLTTKASEVKVADSIMSQFKNGIDSFFKDKKVKGKVVKLTLKDHAKNFAQIVVRTKNLIRTASKKHNDAKKAKNKQNIEKYNNFLVVLNEVSGNLTEMSNALAKDYGSILSFLWALKKVFSKYASKAHIATLRTKFQKLEKYMDKKKGEHLHLNNIIKTLNNLLTSVPKGFLARKDRATELYRRK